MFWKCHSNVTRDIHVMSVDIESGDASQYHIEQENLPEIAFIHFILNTKMFKYKSQM